jgi:hypothetical protein
MSPEVYKTFSATEGILRGFCSECGGTLIWYDTNTPYIEVLVGSIDDIRAANLEITEAVALNENTNSSTGVKTKLRDGKSIREI